MSDSEPESSHEEVIPAKKTSSKKELVVKESVSDVEEEEKENEAEVGEDDGDEDGDEDEDEEV